ncbi:MAG: TonB-dependent receptor [Gemmatimonadetes bacterium]|nr:TonB-dependent receptor [Gemmatimonadota bacterium]
MTRLRVLIAVVLALALAPVAAVAQAGTVRGRVVEQGSNNPLQGVSVSVVGGSQTVVTNQEGRFVLTNVPVGARTLRAARIGYGAQTRSVTVGAEPVEVNFSLGTDVLGLDEIVVIGYGQVERRRAGGGAISSIRPEEVTQSTTTASVENVLQGRVSGVQVQQNSGVPGSAISVRVRGASSISAGNEPLYVIDGVPAIQGDFSLLNIGQTQSISALSSLNPSEIESIEVLKDASAAAIYGSRASNGVVLVTTKRGRAGSRPDIRVQSYVGTQSAWRQPAFLNAQQYVEVQNEAIFNDYKIENFYGFDNDALPSCDAVIGDAPCNVQEFEGGVDTDWIDEILRPAAISNVFASVSGGSERARYYVSGARFNQGGIVGSYGFERMNGRMNLDYTASDRLVLGTSVGLTRGVIDRTRGDNTIYGPFANAIASAPTDRVFMDDGSYNLATRYYENPVALDRENRAEERSVHILGNAFADYRLMEGVSARLNTGLDMYSLRGYMYESALVGAAKASGGSGEVGNSYVTKVLLEGTVNFQREFGDRHAFSGVVGSSYEDNDQEFNQVLGQQFPTGDFRQLASASTITGGDASVTENTLQSVFGRVQHTFADRLTTTFNIRADGSSRFGENNRWGVFPSAAVLYRFGDSPLLQGGFLSDLAVRASYGRTGNQEGLGNFASRGLFSGGANYGDRPGLRPQQLANPDLSWEKTDQLNVGGDVAFLSDRLGLSFDWYNKHTSDLLLNRPIPLTTGFAQITENIGEMRNRGWELAARAQVLRPASARGLSWMTEFNVSHNDNVVTKLYRDEPISGSFVARVEEGQPLGFFYAHRMVGIFRDPTKICTDASGVSCLANGTAFQHKRTQVGDVQFADVNGRDPVTGKLTGLPDGLITADDRVKVGDPWPEYQGGWTNTLEFAVFDITVFTQFSQGNDVYNGNREYTDAFGTFEDNNTINALDRFIPGVNEDTNQPRATIDDPNTNRRASSRFVEDGSYVRVKNLVFGYNVPASMASRLGTSNLRLYVQAQNLYTWTKYSGFDPEVNFSGATSITRGIDFYTLPQARTVSVGLNFGF